MGGFVAVHTFLGTGGSVHKTSQVSSPICGTHLYGNVEFSAHGLWLRANTWTALSARMREQTGGIHRQVYRYSVLTGWCNEDHGLVLYTDCLPTRRL